jgi:hypothetical protein
MSYPFVCDCKTVLYPTPESTDDWLVFDCPQCKARQEFPKRYYAKLLPRHRLGDDSHGQNANPPT